MSSLLLFPAIAIASSLPRNAHHVHTAPLLQLNETEVLQHHEPTPPSYWSIDIDITDPAAQRHPALMALHVLFLSLAFFVVLPVAITMRSAKHRAHGLVVFIFYFLAALGCAAGSLYNKSYRNMYPSSIHRPHGYLLLLSSFALTLFDIIPPIRRLITYIKPTNKRSVKSFWSTVILSNEGPDHSHAPEYIGLMAQDEPQELDGSDGSPGKPFPPNLDDHSDADTLRWENQVNSHPHHHRNHIYSESIASDTTLFGFTSRRHSEDSPDEPPGQDTSNTSPLARIGYFIFLTLERALIFAAYGIAVTGIVVYTGGCRRNYINGCMAHLIKGSVFWCYGLFTFARFLGTFAELGWAWNRARSTKYPSGEFVESLVIFLYGATNTWMERFGANPDEPFTTKQIQHISIAVMFCFAGLVGMGIESKKIRTWLAFSSVRSLGYSAFSQAVEEPPSYIASFNPFPALVIGVTGAAMSAHHQTYLFQVQIHALWGNMLVAFAVLRCLTYFFLWLGPPKSALPSRPPSEILAAFCLACGGLIFMLSTEEVTFAAMRRGRDDVMMFLNFAVALTCFTFCWVLYVVTFKGWITTRSLPSITVQT